MRDQRLATLLRLGALCILALAACAAPTTVAPTATLTPLPTLTATPAATITPPATLAQPVGTALPATSIKLMQPSDIVFDTAGNFFVSDCADGPPQVYKVDPYGQLTVYASPSFGSFDGDGGPALSAHIACAASLAFDHAGNLYVADFFNCRIRRIDQSGLITTVAGSGPGWDPGPAGGFAGDGGPATSALLNTPSSIAFDAAGNLYIADANNNRIRKVDPAGVITTFAGTGQEGFYGDGGPAASAQLHLAFDAEEYFPSLAVAADGSVYITDSGNGRVRKIDPQGIITTVAGGGTDPLGDGGSAAAVALNNLRGLAFDADGNLYAATKHVVSSSDGLVTHSYGRIRKIDRQGIITTVAGGDVDAANLPVEGGAALAASLGDPWGLGLDADGNLYVAYNFNLNGRVRKVDKQGHITTVVGGAP